MAFASRFRTCLVVCLLLAIPGCAYEVSTLETVSRPGRIRVLERIAVAPFLYPNDWTGLFRHVYAQAGIEAPEGKKIEFVEGAFLVRDAVISKGRLVLPWPKELEKTKAEDLLNAKGEIAGAHLAALRDSGAQAVVLARGGRTCADVEVCVASVEIRLLDLSSQDELWKSQAAATTALHHGDEMKAAVHQALSAFPEKSHPSQ